MDDRIVTLNTYIDFMEAEMALGKLQTAGIQCFIDENATNIYPFYTDALGAYKIKVFERDVEKSRKLLAQSEE